MVNGTSLGSSLSSGSLEGLLLEGTTEVSNGDQEGAMFDWYRYDPKPLVENLTPQVGSQVALSSSVNITANVTDNILVDTVIANVTYPNNTVEQVTLLDETGDNIYNGTFANTDPVGTYTVRIIANDTSLHQNINTISNFFFTIRVINNWACLTRISVSIIVCFFGNP